MSRRRTPSQEPPTMDRLAPAAGPLYDAPRASLIRTLSQRFCPPYTAPHCPATLRPHRHSECHSSAEVAADVSQRAQLAGVACCVASAKPVKNPFLARRECKPMCKARPVTDIDVTAATWSEAHAECLVHGVRYAQDRRLRRASAASFANSRDQCPRAVWTRSPCAGEVPPEVGDEREASTRPPPPSIDNEYQPVARMGSCASRALTIATHNHTTLADCLQRCDEIAAASESRQSRCVTISYNFHTSTCELMRRCTERAGLKLGQCQYWWMLRPLDATLLKDFPQVLNWSAPCYFTRYLTSTSTSTTRRRGWHAIVWKDAQRKRAQMKRLNPHGQFCNAKPLLGQQDGVVVNATRNRMWRYYSAVACGTSESKRVCLAFKKMGRAAVIGGLESSDGVTFGSYNPKGSDLLRLELPWEERQFTHNLAILRLGEDWDARRST